MTVCRKECMERTNTLSGKTAVVTGSGQGIGRGIAIYLARQGARVITNNRKPIDKDEVQKKAQALPEEDRASFLALSSDAEMTAEAIRKEGGEADFFYGDVSRPEDAKGLIQKAVDTFGSIDILVNNAAGLGEGTIVSTTEEQWDWMTQAKMKGAFLTMHYAAPFMIAQKSGTILNSASNAWVGISNLCAYSAGNAGLVGLTKATAKELKSYGITVNAYCPRAASPGHIVEFEKTVRTLAAAVPDSKPDPEKLKAVQDEHRDPVYLAPFLAYLCTDDCRDITGQVFGLSASGKIEFYSEPVIIDRQTAEDGIWTQEKLKEKMPETILKTVRSQARGDDW
jgi:3-oxoacyl-[acyl-carrier protein] reductase